MDCLQEGCGGKINMGIRISLQTGCGGCGTMRSPAHPCDKCGRLHWEDGMLTFNRGGNTTFLEEGHVVIRKAETGEEVMRW
ncbi:MAG: hypothetical protein Q8N42_01805 [bacterium]|nr:hypothetical protein [bacterium]